MSLSERPQPPGRGRYDRQASASERARATRAAILEAVRGALSRDEPSELSVADIVSLTHIGRNTFYGHFEDIGRATAEVSLDCLREVDEALGSTVLEGTPHAAVQGFVQEWFRFVVQHPGTVRIACRTAAADLRERLERSLAALHRLGAGAGVFRRVLEPERLSALSCMLLDTSASVAKGRGRPEVSSAATIDAVLALCR